MIPRENGEVLQYPFKNRDHTSLPNSTWPEVYPLAWPDPSGQHVSQLLLWTYMRFCINVQDYIFFIKLNFIVIYRKYASNLYGMLSIREWERNITSSVNRTFPFLYGGTKEITSLWPYGYSEILHWWRRKLPCFVSSSLLIFLSFELTEHINISGFQCFTIWIGPTLCLSLWCLQPSWIWPTKESKGQSKKFYHPTNASFFVWFSY